MDSGLAVSRRPGMTPALMPEMPRPGHHHRDAVVVGGFDHFVVAHRASRLNHSRGAGFDRDQKTIGKRKECILGNH
jgi:hypothetical protein